MAPYAYVCRGCEHLLSGHLLAPDGDLREGPYRCGCGCEIAQDAPMYGVDRDSFHRRERTLRPEAGEQ